MRFGECFGCVDVEFAEGERNGAGTAQKIAGAGVAGELSKRGER